MYHWFCWTDLCPCYVNHQVCNRTHRGVPIVAWALSWENSYDPNCLHSDMCDLLDLGSSGLTVEFRLLLGHWAGRIAGPLECREVRFDFSRGFDCFLSWLGRPPLFVILPLARDFVCTQQLCSDKLCMPLNRNRLLQTICICLWGINVRLAAQRCVYLSQHEGVWMKLPLVLEKIRGWGAVLYYHDKLLEALARTKGWAWVFHVTIMLTFF
jgi:hypothetical protein